MRTLMALSTRQIVGETCGLRKDGSVAVLFDDNQIIWFSPEEFSSTFEVVRRG